MKRPITLGDDPGGCPIPAGPTADDDEEFRVAMQAYKQRSGRQFPTWSEVLEVIRGLGYEKPARRLAVPPPHFSVDQVPRPGPAPTPADGEGQAPVLCWFARVETA